MTNNEILNREHVGWNEFSSLLYDAIFPNGKWHCKGNFQNTEKILTEHFPGVDVPETIRYFKANGGYCDCEVGFNVCAV
jgi:hypothetical protein